MEGFGRRAVRSRDIYIYMVSETVADNNNNIAFAFVSLLCCARIGLWQGI